MRVIITEDKLEETFKIETSHMKDTNDEDNIFDVRWKRIDCFMFDGNQRKRKRVVWIPRLTFIQLREKENESAWFDELTIHLDFDWLSAS